MRRCIGLDVHREFAAVAAYGRPSLLAHKLRALELRAGMPSRRYQAAKGRARPKTPRCAGPRVGRRRTGGRALHAAAAQVA